ncbi:hypothetical protein L596_029769 [Steinernema carpocapsae]|uniref:Acyl-CoA thioesterase-like C-terminal domain-containing protein n=1 Tax=Steinernema carpocapsae TaxID=34508 RepID=A0A4U5LQQ8_STECR|nr:hypothetical protein L596_029769 [Steinernema carpocapsae]
MATSAASERIRTLSGLFTGESIDSKTVRFNGKHLGGHAFPARLFGGQTAAQARLAFFRLHPEKVVLSLKVNFVSPGAVFDPLDYKIQSVPGSPFAQITILQDQKLIGTAKIFYGSRNDVLSEPFFSMPQVPSLSLKQEMKTRVDRSPLANLTSLVHSDLFEIRPTDFEFFVCESSYKSEPLKVWLTLGEPYRSHESSKDADGLSIAILASDHLSMHTAMINYASLGRREEYQVGGSLSHNLTFQEVDHIDPLGWFLYESECRTLSNSRHLTKFRLFDSRGKCILSGVQEGYATKRNK